jgi:small subunit ribosomal protein S4
MEKQKAKFTYGILEKQFSNLFKEALRRKGVTGENLLQMCELRLDNVVFRLGIAPTRRAARQLVTHRHITVNGENVNIPSYALKVGDQVSVRARSKSLETIADSLSVHQNQMEWLEFNGETKLGKVIAAPERIQIPENIKEQLIVELYSK